MTGGIPEWGFIQAAQCAEVFGVSRSTWFRWRRRGLVSCGIRLGYNRTGWPVDEIKTLYEKVKNGDVSLYER